MSQVRILPGLPTTQGCFTIYGRDLEKDRNCGPFCASSDTRDQSFRAQSGQLPAFKPRVSGRQKCSHNFTLDCISLFSRLLKPVRRPRRGPLGGPRGSHALIGTVRTQPPPTVTASFVSSSRELRPIACPCCHIWNPARLGTFQREIGRQVIAHSRGSDIRPPA